MENVSEGCLDSVLNETKLHSSFSFLFISFALHFGLSNRLCLLLKGSNSNGSISGEWCDTHHTQRTHTMCAPITFIHPIYSVHFKMMIRLLVWRCHFASISYCYRRFVDDGGFTESSASAVAAVSVDAVRSLPIVPSLPFRSLVVQFHHLFHFLY